MSANENYVKAKRALNSIKKEYLAELDPVKKAALKVKVREAKARANDLKRVDKGS